MKFLEDLTRKPNKFQRIVGLNINLFNLLVQQLIPHWEKAEEQRKSRSDRERQIGAGHPYKFQYLQHKLLLVLLYYKLYLTQECLGMIVGIDQANISRLLKKMLPLLEQAADPELATYLNKIKEEYALAEKTSNLFAFYEKHPEFKEAVTDTTEQQCYRPQNNDKQKVYFSGKKKRHMLKTQISVAPNGHILDVSDTYPGSVHDKTIIDEEKTIEKFPEILCLRFDSGYQGVKQENPDHYIVLPTKKPKRKELSELAKEHNRVNSKRRIIVEHIFSRLKKFRILGNVYRGSVASYNQIFRSIASIHNFKLANTAIIV